MAETKTHVQTPEEAADADIKDLFEHRESIDLTPTNAHFSKSSGGLISLEVTQPDGKTEVFERVVAIRAFPISAPDEFISIREPDSRMGGQGAEIGMIRRLSDFDAAPAAGTDGSASALIGKELARRYFTPVLKKIHSFSEKFGYSYWDVTTTAGRIEFVTSNPSQSIRTLEDGRIFVYDIDGNCYTIESLEKLDKASLRKIETYL